MTTTTDPMPVLSVPQEPTVGRSADLYGRTHAGTARAENEDHFLVAELWRVMTLRQSSLPGGTDRRGATERSGHIVAVADGVGGHADGELASRAALEGLEQYALSHLAGAATDPAALAEMLQRCEDRVRRDAPETGRTQPPGTTLTVAFVFWPHAHLLHVGDTRCYLVRDGLCAQLTRDHTWGALAQGADAEDDNAVLPYGNVLLNAIGGGSGRAAPELHHVELATGDALVLCSDGLTRSVVPGEIARIVTGSHSASAAGDRLMELALERDGGDNVSIVVAQF